MRVLTEKKLREIIGEHVNAALAEEREGFISSMDKIITDAAEWESNMPSFSQERAEALVKVQTLRGIKDMFEYYIKFKFWHWSK
jgi:hypothetical protein